MRASTAEQVAVLDERVRDAIRQFHHSLVVGRVHDPLLGQIFGELALTVSDIVFVSALAQVHLLLTGPPGCGKTDLATLVAQGLFGSAYHLQKLNPHLNEETFATIQMTKFKESGLREAIAPAPFLRLPSTILDECSRAPAALTNILLGFCDGTIQLKCGIKYDIGHSYRTADGHEERYHWVVGTMNEGREYAGTFELDPALSRRFTIRIPFCELRPTPADVIAMLETRNGHAARVDSPNSVDQLARAGAEVRKLPFDPFAFLYLVYLVNLGRCPHVVSGFHPLDGSQEVCVRAECRILKIEEGFCPSVAGLGNGVAIFLKRAACALAALRAARMLRAIKRVFAEDDQPRVDKLRDLFQLNVDADELEELVIAKYCEQVAVTAQDITTLLPFVGLGGKVWMADEYVAKQFAGSTWSALLHYANYTLAALEGFFRQNDELFKQLSGRNGAVTRINTRLEHAERFNDPWILHTLGPLIDRRETRIRGPEEIQEYLVSLESLQQSAQELVQSP